MSRTKILALEQFNRNPVGLAHSEIAAVNTGLELGTLKPKEISGPLLGKEVQVIRLDATDSSATRRIIGGERPAISDRLKGRRRNDVDLNRKDSRTHEVGVVQNPDGSETASFTTSRSGKFKDTVRVVTATRGKDGKITDRSVTSTITPKGRGLPRITHYSLPIDKSELVDASTHVNALEHKVATLQEIPFADRPIGVLPNAQDRLTVATDTRQAIAEDVQSTTQKAENLADAVVLATINGLYP